MRHRPPDPSAPASERVDRAVSGGIPLGWLVPGWALASVILAGFIVMACRVRGIDPQSPSGWGVLGLGALVSLGMLQALLTHAVGRRLRRLGRQGRSDRPGWELLPAADAASPALLADVQDVEDEMRRLRAAADGARQQARRLAQERDALLCGLPHAVLTVDLDGQILHANGAAAAMLAGESGELTGTRLGPRLRWPGEDALAATLRDLSETPGAMKRRVRDGEPAEVLAPGPTGLWVQVDVSCGRVREDRRLIAVLTDVTDLFQRQLDMQQQLPMLATQRDQLQAELTRERARAQAASRSKSEFLANMSHELRTPMNAILNLAQLAQRDATLPRQATTLTRVVDASQRLMDLLSDILQLARLEAGTEAAARQDMGLHAGVLQVVQVLGAQAAIKGLELVPWFDANVPALVRTDEAGLRQVLLNLTGNALKFTERGHVTIRVRLLTDAGDGPALRIEVTDTGIGIPHDVLERLGQPFEQAEQSSTRSFGGTGLGLALVRRLLARMGAHLQARSQPGRGSTFWFDLPVAPSAAAPARWPAAATLQSRRVLVINDLADARAAITAHLDALGCLAQGVGSGPEALIALSHAETDGQPFDVCVLDAQMQDGDVQQLGRRIRSLSRGAPPLLVALISREAGDDVVRTLAAGMAAVVTKPCGPAQLAEALQTAERQPRLGRDSSLLPAGFDESGPIATSPPPSTVPSPAPSTDSGPTAETLAAHWKTLSQVRAEWGMRMVRGDPVAFGRLLERFVQSHGEDATRVETMVAQQAWGDLQLLAHALKSTAGAIGALEVAALAAAVPVPDAHGAVPVDAADRARALAVALQTLMRDIDDGLARAPRRDVATSSGAVVKPMVAADQTLLRELERLLERRDMGALRFAREHEDAIRLRLGKSAAGLLHAVAAFDYDKALACVRGEPGPASPARSRWPALGDA